MVPKRSRLEIYLDVLKVIKRDIHKPTRIMYASNLSWKPLMKILKSLIEQGLIWKEDERNHSVYHLTEKGRDLLDYFKEATKLLEVR